MVRIATEGDLGQIMQITNEAKKIMAAEGNPQWDDRYPLETDFANDIEQQSLYVCERNGEVAGFVCINSIQPKEYEAAAWTSADPCLVLHRMAVSPAARKSGVATEMIQFFEQRAAKNNITNLRTDTNAMNFKMNALFAKLGYKKTGVIDFRGLNSAFYCYEKSL